MSGDLRALAADFPGTCSRTASSLHVLRRPAVLGSPAGWTKAPASGSSKSWTPASAWSRTSWRGCSTPLPKAIISTRRAVTISAVWVSASRSARSWRDCRRDESRPPVRAGSRGANVPSAFSTPAGHGNPEFERSVRSAFRVTGGAAARGARSKADPAGGRPRAHARPPGFVAEPSRLCGHRRGLRCGGARGRVAYEL